MVILGIALFGAFLLAICGAAVLQSFDSPSGKIVLDAPLQLSIVTEQGHYLALYGCDETKCYYGFPEAGTTLPMVLEVYISKFPDHNRTFEQIVKQDWAIIDLPLATLERVTNNGKITVDNVTFTPLGEWTTSNEGRKMYFQRNPTEMSKKPYALIDYLDTNQLVEIDGPELPDSLLAIAKSFKLITKVTEQPKTKPPTQPMTQPKTQPGFEILLAAIGLFAAGYMRRKEQN